MKKPVVLFLCSRNIARSQMAEGLLRAGAGERFEVYSGGLHPGVAVHPLAVRVMSEIGIDISGYEPTASEKYVGRLAVRYAIIVCEAAERQCPKLWPFTIRQLSWPIQDPTCVRGPEECRLEAFRRARDELWQRIEEFLQEEHFAGDGHAEILR